MSGCGLEFPHVTALVNIENTKSLNNIGMYTRKVTVYENWIIYLINDDNIYNIFI